MKKIYQTILGENGNCLNACLASLLDIDIDSIPNPKHTNWQDEINEWLIKNCGVYMLTVSINGDNLPQSFKNSYVIGCGVSTNNRLHAVICRNFEIIHDPYPYKSIITIDKIENYDLIVKYFEP